MSLSSSTVRALINIGASKTVSTGQTSSTSVAVDALKTLTDGIAADQAQQFWWSAARSLVATSEDIDMADPVAADGIGDAFALTEIKGFFIRNNSATDVLKVGGKATTAAFDAPFNGVNTSIFVIRPGGFILVAASDASGYACTDTTDDILKIDAGAATLTYDILIWGNSAA